jgi:outer membrane protein assembly factor BamE (lipoprotein component of BamABCDE complex)
MRILGFVLTVALLAGCAAGGVKVTDQQLGSLKPGETTEQQVTQLLGRPTMRTRMHDGSAMVFYSYYEAKVRPETFIPFAGAFVGGTDTRTNTVMLRFDQDGKLLTTSSTESAFGSGLGAAAGQISSEPTMQPRQ